MNNPDPKKVTIGDYFLPKNWVILLLLGLTRIISILPFKALLGLGSVIGSLLYLLPSSRKYIAKRNIELCFPDLSEKERDSLLRKHFASLGIGFLEVGIARWKSNKSLKKIVKVEGIEYLKEAVKKDKGVILMSAHFTLLEITALIAREGITENLPPLVGMYRVGSNPIINRFFRATRLRSVESLVTKFEIKGLIRALKDKKIVWYASDQSFAGKNAVEVDFFGHQASTTSAICRFVEMTGSPVLPYFAKRLENGKGYVLQIYPEVDPDTSDPQKYMQNIYTVLEEHILQHPEQYYWVHRRFKNTTSSKDPYNQS